MSDEVPPIKLALMNTETNQLEPGRYDDRKEADAALDELDNPEEFTIVETRESHQVDPETLAAEEEQIEANGRRDVDEPSDG